MKVCLRRGYHTVYDELVNYPPVGIEYTIPKIVTPSKSKVFNFLRRRLWRAYVDILNKPNIISLNCKNVDLIHSGAGFLVKNQFPWVIDLEHVSSFVSFRTGKLEKVKTIVQDILSNDYCRKIMPWTNAGALSILSGLDCSEFKDKIQVIYPAMHLEEIKKSKKSDKVNLLFISNRFFTKGGKEVLEAYAILKEKYDLSFTIISEVPEKIQRANPDVIFRKPNIPREDLFKNFLSKSDIFVLPSYMDTFGMVFLEAMSFGLPIVSSNVLAIPEIIGSAGFVIDVDKYSWYGKDYLFAWDSWERFSDYVEKQEKPEVVSQLVEKLKILIEDDNLRKKMGSIGRREVEKGKFSIDTRNIKLREIYEEAARI